MAACNRQRYGRTAKQGQSLVEYGLCLALVAVVCITALNSLGLNLSDKLDCIASAISIGGNTGNGGC